jgi:hypothetical protein
MSLIDDVQAAPRGGAASWPPAGHKDRLRQQRRWQALARNDRGEVATMWREELKEMLDHDQARPLYPAPKLASRIIASFLFGEAARITMGEGTADTALEAWRDATGVDLALREGARTCAVQGEVYLRPVWDQELSPWPLLTVEPGRRVIPAFRHRILVEAIVFSSLATDEGTVWRLLEHHEPSVITSYLFKGTEQELGKRHTIGASGTPSRWADVEEEVDTETEQLTLVHVPFDRDSDDAHGISLFDGTEGLILGIHRLYMQEQHDAELARRRIALPKSYLTRDSQGRPGWDRTTDLLELADEAAGTVGAETPIKPIEFHDDNVQRERIQGRLRDFFLACGIAPQTLGEEAGTAESGTARKLAQSLTIQTVADAAGYWVHALRVAIPLALFLGSRHLKPTEPAIPQDLPVPNVEPQDGFVADQVEEANVVAILDSADAISPEEKVERLHPDWPEEDKALEVQRIKDAAPVASVNPMSNPFAAAPAEGAGE